MLPKVVRIIARLNVGGPAKHVVWLTDGLKDSHQTMLVAGTVPPGEGDMSYFAEQMNVVPHIIPEMSREISLKDVVTIWKLYGLFLRERPDIIHTHTAKAGTVGRVAGFLYRWLTPGVLVGRPRKCKFIHTYHGHIFHSYYSRAKTKVFITIEKMLARLVTDRVIVISEQQGDEICNQFGVGRPEQIRVIPLGLDLDVFDRSQTRRGKFREELGIDDETVLIGIVGRLTDVKNHALFLQVVSRFAKRNPGELGRSRFVVVGDGSLRSGLEELSRSLNLEEYVTFAGERDDPEYFYPALDLVALTSRNEGTPLTLIEAMANGLPVIATSVGGVVDLLGGVEQDGAYKVCERGVSVPPGDADAFAAGLAALVDDESLRDRLARNGYAFVQMRYPKQRLLNDVKSLYEELLSGEAGAYGQLDKLKHIEH